jgi:signal transduction histidine kinase
MPSSSPRARSRPRLWSLRGRITVLVMLFASLVLIPAGVVAGLMVRHSLTSNAWQQVRHEAVTAAAAVRRGHLAAAVTPQVTAGNLIQVVGRGHHVIASSGSARGLPPLTGSWPTSQNAEQDVQTCAPPPAGCVRIAAIRVRSAADSPVVYAGRRVPGPLSTGLLDTFFMFQVAALIGLTGWGTWKVTGRILRPVEAIRTELVSINVNDLSRRVPEPLGQDEIARLARTINMTLARLEDAKGRLERMLDQQQRFTSDVSHELRNPIAGLRVLLEEAQSNPDRGYLLTTFRRALENVDRLQVIINDLLLLADLQPNAPTPHERMDLAQFVRAEIARRTDRHQIQLNLKPGVMVDAVPSHIGRILANLLDNAQRHAKHTVRVDVRDCENFAELSVTDDGDGIAEADSERVFQRFTRLQSARTRDPHGTGLGLSIARTIALAHHGTLHTEHPPTGGARFVLRLPLVSHREDVRRFRRVGSDPERWG